MNKWLLISILALGSCKRADDLFKSYGAETTETRQVGAFSKIVAGEKFDVILVQDSAREGRVEMTAGKNVIDGYSTEVIDSELRIVNKNKFNWVRKLNVRQTAIVYFRRIDEIQINGSAKFTCRDTIAHPSMLKINHGGLEDAIFNIHGDYIFANCSNTGGLVLKGSCFLYSGTADDISFVDSRDLRAKKSYLTSYSRMDCHVNGIEVLDIRLFGVGNIFYSRQPANTLAIEDKGEGDVIKQ